MTLENMDLSKLQLTITEDKELQHCIIELFQDGGRLYSWDMSTGLTTSKLKYTATLDEVLDDEWFAFALNGKREEYDMNIWYDDSGDIQAAIYPMEYDEDGEYCDTNTAILVHLFTPEQIEVN
jgi:hypothetical protein